MGWGSVNLIYQNQNHKNVFLENIKSKTSHDSFKKIIDF